MARKLIIDEASDNDAIQKLNEIILELHHYTGEKWFVDALVFVSHGEFITIDHIFIILNKLKLEIPNSQFIQDFETKLKKWKDLYDPR